MKKYELLIFDADDTLFDYSKAEAAALEGVFIKNQLEYKPEKHLKAYQKFNSEVWKEFEKGTINADNLKIERFKRLVNHLNISVDVEILSEDYLSKLAESAVLFTSVKEILSDLSKKFKIGLITNGLTKVQKNRLKLSGIEQFFDCVVISEEVGFQKPDRRIFDLMLEKTKIKDKQSVLMIGDNLLSDIMGAQNTGINTCWANYKNLPNDTIVRPDYIITEISQLVKIL